MSWSNAYLGIPHLDLGRDRNGADCWGLLRIVYAAELQVDLPSYGDRYDGSAERAQIEALIAGAPDWADWSPVLQPLPFDALLFRRGPYRAHVGVIVRAPLMLHMAETGARIEDIRHARWADRLVGIYRHRSQTESPRQ